jgi:NAD(P)-dependent dehydrogenase (short-subunit alcohol dehydrogenase family)
MSPGGEPKVALVTGASSGIGQATAVELARRGHQVAIHYFRNEKGARDTFELIRGLDQGRARVYACDLRDHSGIGQLAGDVLSDFGRLDTLVNNAGSLVARKALAEMDYELWQEVIAINLTSVFLVTRACLPFMIKQGKGSIVNVASLTGRTGGTPGGAAYAAAKGALITLTKGMAREFIAHGIRVNCVSPGVIATPWHERFSNDETVRKFIAAVPQKRAGTSEEVARAIAFLASDDSGYILGECLEINGGMLMD